VSAEEVGEFVDSCGPGVIFERDGRVAGYAATGEGDETILLVDPGDGPEPALEALVAWLGERGRHEIDSYAPDARRIAWLEAKASRSTANGASTRRRRPEAAAGPLVVSTRLRLLGVQPSQLESSSSASGSTK
jgi:hypothetical protein